MDSLSKRARLTVNAREAQDAVQIDGFSRSPHPYHRRGPSLQQDDTLNDTECRTLSLEAATLTPSIDTRSTYFDADHRKRRRLADTSSESGTEADDEKETFLLGLPAPSPKPHKGLKGAKGSGSPLLTPSFFDDEKRRTALEWQARKGASVHSQNAETEAAKVREKFRKRRRAEIIRRVTETALFFAICYVVVHPSLSQDPGAAVRKAVSSGSYGFFNPLTFSSPVSSFLAIITVLYAIYPVRIIIRNHALNAAKDKSRFYIHLPAAFDPAPLLYPVFIPALVAWSVEARSSRMLLLNLALGISSMPSKTIPIGERSWHGSPQWLLSVLPAVLDQRGFDQSKQLAWKDRDIDSILFLFPLHQSLLPALHYLTTTSLLVSELQLLSTSLINLLLLSQSPQAVILKALLWIGGLSLLVLCTKALSLGVKIARIPSWRFRRSNQRSYQGSGLFEGIRDCINTIYPNWRLMSTAHDSSDEDVDLRTKTRPRQKTLQLSTIKTIDLDLGYDSSSLQRYRTMPTAEQISNGVPPDASMNGLPKSAAPLTTRHRSSTLPAIPGYLDRRRSSGGDRISIGGYQIPSMRTFTAAQATMVRWLLAGYAYMTIVVVIAFPLRHYVSIHALNLAEPIGWVIEYLLGDLWSVHRPLEYFYVASWKLGNRSSEYASEKCQGRGEAVRAQLGYANTRLLICAYCVVTIISGLTIVFRLSGVADVDTRRKVFHGMMVVMFLPTIFIDPAFVALAFIIILALFLLLDLLRASQLPPLAKPLTLFLAPYVDGRDHRGPVIVSHIFLLVGCAIPFWLSLASMPRISHEPWEGWDVPIRDLSMISGVVCVGMGDAAASLFGRRYGRRRWCWLGGKSLEGSLAFALAVVLGLSIAKVWLLVGGWESTGSDPWPVFLVKAAVAGTGASLTEAVLTGGNDNVIVPVVLWLMVRGLQV